MASDRKKTPSKPDRKASGSEPTVGEPHWLLASDGTERARSRRHVAPVRRGAPRTSGDYVRLPRGERVALRRIDGDSVGVWLARHLFHVELSNPPAFLGGDGRRIQLREGANSIGREPGNDVALAAELRDLSRRHLLLEVKGGRPVAITDLSSRGTFVPRAWFLERPVAAA